MKWAQWEIFKRSEVAHSFERLNFGSNGEDPIPFCPKPASSCVWSDKCIVIEDLWWWCICTSSNTLSSIPGPGVVCMSIALHLCVKTTVPLWNVTGYY